LRSGETVTLTLVPSVTVTVRIELFFAALRQITASVAAQIHRTGFFIGLLKGYRDADLRVTPSCATPWRS